MGKSINTVAVHTKQKTYKIIIGNSVLSQLIRIDQILKMDRIALIVSSRVMELHNDLIKSSIKGYNNVDIFRMNDGEENKNYKYAEEFLNKMLKKGYSRRSAVLGIGGGVVGDFAGYIASVYMRGIPVIHVPTTLLAMVDSSIGGKVAVNLSAGKNIVGAFHQPQMVISDAGFIQTLPDKEFKNGLSEVLKHALIGEKKTFEILNKNNLESIKKPDNILEIVYLSALFKSKIVEKDEGEKGIRAILNFGHTAGHAIESISGFKGISHGEAVAIGIKIETEISRLLGWINDEQTNAINKLIAHYGLIHKTRKLNADKIIDHMKYDKKNFGGKIKFVLLKGLYKPVYNQEVDYSLIKDAVKSISV